MSVPQLWTRACRSLRLGGDLVADASCLESPGWDDALLQDHHLAALPAVTEPGGVSAPQWLQTAPLRAGVASCPLSLGHSARSSADWHHFIICSAEKVENSLGAKPNKPEVPLKKNKRWQVIGLGLAETFPCPACSSVGDAFTRGLNFYRLIMMLYKERSRALRQGEVPQPREAAGSSLCLIPFRCRVYWGMSLTPQPQSGERHQAGTQTAPFPEKMVCFSKWHSGRVGLGRGAFRGGVWSAKGRAELLLTWSHRVSGRIMVHPRRSELPCCQRAGP